MKFILLAVFLGTLAIGSAEILKLAKGAEAVAGEYVILLKDGVDTNQFIRSAVLRRNNGELSKLDTNLMNTWNTEIKGFSARLDENEAKMLDSMAEVDSIGPNQIFYIAAPVTQTGAPYGLARVSRRSAVQTPYTYTYDDTAGAGTTVYVIDTGINVAHNDFGGRAIQGANFVSGEAITDGNGHGTHCAGTVGGTTYGVAKRTRLIAVKVLGNSGSGTLDGVISGVNWALSNSTGNRPNSFGSMSLGSSLNTQVNNAVSSAVSAGLAIAVAAGNSGANACNYSPAAVASAFTVGATNAADQITSWSNYGNCVNILAPGNSILSTWIGSNTATNTISGTSMACPHVAGLAAYLRGRDSSLSTPAAVLARLRSLAVNNTVSGLPSGTPNALINNDFAS